jgi:hypothetical protein
LNVYIQVRCTCAHGEEVLKTNGQTEVFDQTEGSNYFRGHVVSFCVVTPRVFLTATDIFEENAAFTFRDSTGPYQDPFPYSLSCVSLTIFRAACLSNEARSSIF